MRKSSKGVGAAAIPAERAVFAVDALALYSRIRPASVEAVKAELEELDRIAGRRANNPRLITFQQAAERYLSESHHLASIKNVTYHVSLLLPFIGQLPISDIHKGTLEPFIKARLENDRVALKTVRESVAQVVRILRLAARSWRHTDGTPWLATAPPFITVDAPDGQEEARQPYELSWEEQDILLAALPPEPQRQMAQFVLNTGTMEHEVCALRWTWEEKVSGFDGSVFLIPNRLNAKRQRRVVVLNKVARAVVDARRGIHPEVVFSWRRFRPKHVGEADHRKGQPLTSMNNTAWQSARERAAAVYAKKYGRPAETGFKNVRLLDLRHTFGCRLRAAAVGEEVRKTLLGNIGRGDRATYSAEEIREFLAAAEKISRTAPAPALKVTDESSDKVTRPRRRVVGR